jgi:hypothetical protein
MQLILRLGVWRLKKEQLFHLVTLIELCFSGTDHQIKILGLDSQFTVPQQMRVREMRICSSSPRRRGSSAFIYWVPVFAGTAKSNKSMFP